MRGTPTITVSCDGAECLASVDVEIDINFPSFIEDNISAELRESGWRCREVDRELQDFCPKCSARRIAGKES